jgi:MoxR-like ATPase
VEEVLALQAWSRGVGMAHEVRQYIIDVCQATRRDPSLQLPAGPRASLALMFASRVVAASQGREDVLPDDVGMILQPVLAHRLTLTPEAELREETVDGVVARIVERVRPHLLLDAGS